jgi:pimeloyl-ACP methyl ester carboxylesterase
MLLCGAAYAEDMPFVHAPEFKFAGPAMARGALIWIHGTYGRDQTGPPPPPDFVGREAATGLDVWCFNRDRGDDPLARGAEALTHGVTLLRGMGYTRVIISGHSRGAWIALSILAHPGLADAVVAFDPAAHGRSEDRKVQAIADWSALWARAVSDVTRVVLVQLADDPWDPDPARRLLIARKQLGRRLLSIFQPDAPTGHAGVYEPAFDQQFGARIETFVK